MGPETHHEDEDGVSSREEEAQFFDGGPRFVLSLAAATGLSAAVSGSGPAGQAEGYWSIIGVWVC